MEDGPRLCTEYKTTPSWAWPGSRDTMTQFRNFGTPNKFWTKRAIRLKFGTDIEDGPSLHMDYPIRNNIYVSNVHICKTYCYLSVMTCKSAYISNICQVYDHMPIYVVTHIHLYEYHSLIILAYVIQNNTYVSIYVKVSAVCLSYVTCKSAYVSDICQVGYMTICSYMLSHIFT